MDDLLPDFLSETAEGLAALDDALLRLERLGDDPATVSEVFRLVHTIKGTCGFLGLARLERVAHAAESVLGQVRDGVIAVTPGLVTSVLQALDRVKLITAALAQDGVEPAGDDNGLIEALRAIAEGRGSDGGAAEPAGPVAAAGAAAPEPDRAPEPDATAQTIRVAVDVLEDLMTLVSELVLTRNQLLQLSRTHEAAAFSTPLERLSQITSDLQEGVMKTRMQPIGNAWSKLPRLVRDLSRELGKQVELSQSGQDTELDRQVLELIRDPLTHMVRNAMDHGLESPAARRAAGKPEKGRITLSASHQGGHVVLDICDDGRGLDTDRIREKVLAQGLASSAEVAAMGAAELHRFIFHPGFSTAAQVTAISGRGVGMDVVKTNIERINGTVDVESRPGCGTEFAIKIPLTLAIVSALIVEVAGERFAIPQINVIELVHAAPARTPAGGEAAAQPTIEHLDGTPVLRLRDRLLPLVSLRDLLRLDAAADADAGASAYIVVASVGSTSVGIIVDRVFDTEEIVVKPVPPILRHITMFSGNTILGDGAVIMILDPNGLARATGLASASEAPAVLNPAAVAQSDDNLAILLFRAGDAAPKAVPLGLVARLEDIAHDAVERSAGRPVVQYRGKLMPIIPIAGELAAGGRGSHPVLVFTEAERSLGLVVDEIVDVVNDRLRIELGSGRPGVLGTAVIAGQATDVIDAAWWLAQAGEDWFGKPAVPRGRARLLVVEDSDFFRQMLIPTLSAAGFDVTACDGGDAALAMLDAGPGFDAVVSDIEMPGMDGLALVRRIRAGPRHAALPVIALSGRTSPADLVAARAAGFTDHIPKFDRDLLLASLQRALAGTSMSTVLMGAPA